jgi:imidazolonepropionase-like amidohydrolase
MPAHIRVIVTASITASLVLTGQAEKIARQTGVVALRGATLMTVTNGTIPNGTVVIRNGKIAAAGANVQIPADAELVEVGGRFISPGIIDAHSHLAIDDVNETGTTVSSMTAIEDVLNPTDVNIYRDVAGGVTTANVLHGSANPIGGKSAVIKLRWGKPQAKDLLFEGAIPGVKFALGENPKLFSQPPGRRFPATRPGTEFVIRDAFTRAKEYQNAWKLYEAAKVGRHDVLPPRRDLQLEPLVEVLEGKRLVHAHCYRTDDILTLIQLSKELGFRIATFQHVLEGYKVAKEIAAYGAGASTFADVWGLKLEAADGIPYNAALMMRKGVLVSINSDGAERARSLNTEAAKSIKWGGLSDEEALALITINPARQLRIDDRVGSIERGKDADLVVWTHHPLSSYAIVERTYIDGVVYYDRRADERRLTELLKEKARLAAGGNENRSPLAAVKARASTDSPAEVSGDAPRVRRTTPPAWSAAPIVTSGSDGHSGAGSVWAITNAVIHPITAPTLHRGTIVMRGDKIQAIGENVQLSADTRTIDAMGQHVYPGFINARTTLGIVEAALALRGVHDVSEMLDIAPQLRVHVAYHNESEAIPIARANGITTVGVAPSGGTLAGQMAAMNLAGWTSEEATIRPNVGIIFNFPSILAFWTSAEQDFDNLRRERDRKLDQLIRLLNGARAYASARPGSAMDWTLEALVPIAERRLPLITTVNREQDIRDAIAFGDRARVNIVISGGSEAALVAPLLRDKAIPVIIGNVLTLPAREDFFHADSYQLAGRLVNAGVKVAFATGDANTVALLPYHAAKAVAWGLGRDEALKALTINAAEILGISDRVGSLEPGKDANLFVADGDPLEVRTNVTRVVIAGRDVPLDNKQLALYRKYMARP